VKRALAGPRVSAFHGTSSGIGIADVVTIIRLIRINNNTKAEETPYPDIFKNSIQLE
jgi:hypothetical protein